MWWRKKTTPGSRLVHVEMVDREGQRLITSDMPIEQLPQSFEAATTLHIRGEDFDVVEADPMTAEEFGRTGRLRLVLRKVKIETIDPRQVLFSLPTISDELPPVAPGTTKLKKDVLEMAEDDWRQTEFVHLSHDLTIDRELADVAAIYAEKRQGQGFKELHVRKRIPEPLAAARIDLSALPAERYFDGVGFYGVAGLIAGGFALRMRSGIELYGVTRGGIVSALCVHVLARRGIDEADINALQALAREHQLCVVDWCDCRRVSPDEFVEFFEPTLRGDGAH
jgi:hypothetical protein